MDFTPTEAQLDLTRLTAEVCAKLVTADRIRELDAEGRFDGPLWQSLAETGVLAAALPESVGGGDFGALEQSAVLRELGKHVAAVPYLWSIVVGAGALARFGPDAQQDWARQAGEGSIILTAGLAEEHNWEPTKPTTVAHEADGVWRLTGAKTTVPYADRAARILVPATVSGATALFLVDPSDATVNVTAQRVVDFSAEFGVEFHDTPAELVATVDSGAEILDWILTRAWLGLSAQQLGTLERALSSWSPNMPASVSNSARRSAASRQSRSASPTPTSTSRDCGWRSPRPPGGFPRIWPARKPYTRPSSGPPMPDTGWRTPWFTCTAASASTATTSCTTTSPPRSTMNSHWAGRVTTCGPSALCSRKLLPDRALATACRSLERVGIRTPESARRTCHRRADC